MVLAYLITSIHIDVIDIYDDKKNKKQLNEVI